VAWDPAQYLKFADHRLRPAIDLLNRVALEHAGEVYDLGAGAGNVTRLIKERWPEARVTGVDDSPAMLAKAAATAPAITWQQADLATWSPPRPADLIYSNAALHWLTGHERLFPALLAARAPAGVLAVQMPRNHAAPSHAAIGAVVREASWAARLAGVRGIAPVASAAHYLRLLSPRSSAVEAWESEYIHVLTGPDPVVEWTKGTTLRPYLDALGADAEAFLASCAARLRAAYPPEDDGRTLFPFRRVFIVATR